MIDEREWQRLARYVGGEASSDEAAATRRWIDADGARQRLCEQMRETWDVAGFDETRWNSSGAWRRLTTRMQTTATHQEAGKSVDTAGGATVRKLFNAWPQSRLGMYSLRRAVGFSGVLGAVILAVGLAWVTARIYRADRHAATHATAPAREIATRRGERATLDLTDGTRVILAPESRLRIPVAYYAGIGIGSRDVELDGEAYFEVTHDIARPFRVRTAVGVAEDVGTEFVVTAYPETRGMRVLVASGAVAIHQHSRVRVGHNANNTVVPDTMRSQPLALLRPGDLAQLDSAGMLSVQQGVNMRRWLAWTSGRLVFVDTPLPEVLTVLQRWYDVEFRVNDAELAASRVTTTFDRTTMQNVVEAFEMVLHLRAERHGRVVTLFAR